MISADQVTALWSSLDGQIEAANTAVSSCTGMSAATKTAWEGFYSGWKNGPYAAWATAQQYAISSIPSAVAGAAVSAVAGGAGLLNMGQTISTYLDQPKLYSEMCGYLTAMQQGTPASFGVAAVQSWQAIVQAACPSYTPTAVPVPQPLPKEPDWLSEQLAPLSNGIKIVGGIAVAGLVGYGAFQIFSLVGAVSRSLPAKKEAST